MNWIRYNKVWTLDIGNDCQMVMSDKPDAYGVYTVYIDNGDGTAKRVWYGSNKAMCKKMAKRMAERGEVE